MKNNYKYKIYYPSGNITALVDGIVNSKRLRKIINNEIIKTESDVEQVGFWDREKKQFMMAGGEFCVNGLRCAFFDLFKRDIFSEGIIKDLGTGRIFLGGVDKENIWIKVPDKDYYKKIYPLRKNLFRVDIGGINLLLINKNNYESNEFKKEVYKILMKEKLIDECAASGVIYWWREKESYFINPFIWVRAVKTLFNESACGSGSIALGLLRVFKEKKDFNKFII